MIQPGLPGVGAVNERVGCPICGAPAVEEPARLDQSGGHWLPAVKRRCAKDCGWARIVREEPANERAPRRTV